MKTTLILLLLQILYLNHIYIPILRNHFPTKVLQIIPSHINNIKTTRRRGQHTLFRVIFFDDILLRNAIFLPYGKIDIFKQS